MMRKLTEGVSVVAVAIVSVVAFADVAQERLDELDPGLKQIGLLSTCEAKDLKSSQWSIGCETPVRDLMAPYFLK